MMKPLSISNHPYPKSLTKKEIRVLALSSWKIILHQTAEKILFA